MSILVDQNTRLIVQGLTGREGTFHAKGCAAYGTQGGGRSDTGQGRHHARRLAGVQHGGRRGERDGGQCDGDLRASAVCGRCDHGSRGRRGAADCLHHRRDSDARHGDGVALHGRPQVAADRAELSGNHFAGQVQDRDHAGQHSPRREDRNRVALGHADLRGGAPAHAARDGTIDGDRHRRRSDHRHQLRGCAGTVPMPTRRPRRSS